MKLDQINTKTMEGRLLVEAIELLNKSAIDTYGDDINGPALEAQNILDLIVKSVGNSDLKQGKKMSVKTAIDDKNLIKLKAERWDALEQKISAFYVDEKGEELPEDEGGNLLDVGEAAAQAFGFM